MSVLTDLVDGFVNWQTPLSFLAGIGTHHIWVKYWRDRKRDSSVSQEG